MNAALSFIRTRIAPTPSGFLHIGNVLSFAITAAIARKTGARILLRIDDLDRPRVQPQYVRDIFDTLHFLQIPWDEGPADYWEFEQQYSQVHRLPYYHKALSRLRESGQLFACTCSRTMIPDGIYPGTCLHKNLPFERANASWRLRTNNTETLQVKTLSGTISQAVLPETMHYFIVRKKDGFPAYQLASVIDDQHFGVDLVVRGEDLWPSTLAQQYLGRLLDTGFDQTTFVHHPLLMETDEQKLSKSAGATSIRFLRQQGKRPEDIYSLIAQLLGYTTPVYDWQTLGALASQ